jgi:hypothetical protein
MRRRSRKRASTSRHARRCAAWWARRRCRGGRRLLGRAASPSCARPPSWKKYVLDNQLEESFLPGEKFRASINDISKQLKEQFVAAGVKVVR